MNRSRRRREKWDEFVPYGNYEEFVNMVGDETANITMRALRLPAHGGLADFDNKSLWESMRLLRERGYIRIWMRWHDDRIDVLPEFLIPDSNSFGGSHAH